MRLILFTNPVLLTIGDVVCLFNKFFDFESIIMRISIFLLLVLNINALFAQELDTSKYYNIKAVHSGHYLSVGANSMQHNARVLQWSKRDNASEDGQSFRFVPVGQYYKIEVRNKYGKCLTLAENKMGASVLMSKFEGSDLQLWQVHTIGSRHRILCKKNGWSFDIAGVSTAKGALLTVWETVEGAENQLYTFIEALDEQPYWENLGADINSDISETQPCLSPDGRQLYFSRGHNVAGLISDGNIYVAAMNDDDQWGKPVEVVELNNKNHNAVLGFLPGGNELLLFGDYTGGDALFSRCAKTKSGWASPQPILLELPRLTQSIWSGTLGSDGKTLLIDINITGRMNESDIYVSFLKENNEWSKPVSLGNQINVAKAWDGTPYLSADMTTLYFNSTREGKGSSFYMSKRLDDSWTKWSKPLKLETSMYEDALQQYYQPAGHGEYAYFISMTKSYGEGDIHRMKLEQAARPEPFLIVSGKSIDAETDKPMAAQIIFEDLETGENYGRLTSDPSDGAYQIALPNGKNYAIFATSPEYYPLSDKLDLRELKSHNNEIRNLYMVPVKAGETIVLNNVFFDFNQSKLKPESFPELNRVISLLEGNPEIKIEIRGHTDDIGNEDDNLKLSEDRAKSVRQYLVANGFSSDAIHSNGFGESKPVASNSTEEGRELNRRVEFLILSK